jgi:transcriptional regulator with XRE-family HTH domain
MVETKAQARLKALLEGSTQSSLAQELGVGQSRVSQWCSGQSRPEPHFREALWILLRIPRSAWLTTEEATFLRRISLLRADKRQAA